MPVQVASFLIPKSGGSWYVLEDKYLRGGLRVVVDATERDTIHTASRKRGMLVLTTNDNVLWQLESDLLTWAPYQTSSGTASLYTHIQTVPSATWQINHLKNCIYFTYSIFDAQGKSVIPNEIQIVDANNVSIAFSTETAGHCVFNFDLTA